MELTPHGTQQEPQQVEGWRRHLDDSARKVEAHLADLQTRHRLAMHCIEGHDKTQLSPFPGVTIEKLKENSDFFENHTDGHAAKNDLNMLSMTLLPNAASGKSVVPYYTTPTNISYLFDLDTTHDHPAKVLKAFGRVASTGYGFKNKDLSLNRRTGIPQLDAIYSEFADRSPRRSEREIELLLVNALFRYPELSGHQLDALGESFASVPKKIIAPNECVIAPTQKHIAAIMVPVFDKEPPDNPEDGIQYSRVASKQIAKLTGSLAGLEHAQKGMELPVVFYHVSSPTDRGRCTYIAKGQQECRAKALEALHELGSMPDTKLPAKLQTHVKRLLGIDANMSLAEQGIRGSTGGRGV